MPSRQYEDFLLAITNNDVANCQRIIESTRGKILAEKDEAGRNILHQAVFYDKPDITAHLASNFESLVRGRDNSGNTPLDQAVIKDKPAHIEKILEAQPDIINAKDSDGNTILHIAAKNDSTNIGMLLAAGADKKARNNEGMTPLHFAAGHAILSDAVAQLSDDRLISAEDKKGRTPLHYAVAQNKDARNKIEELRPDDFSILMGMIDHKGITPSHLEESKRGALSEELDAMANRYISGIAPEEHAKAASTPARSRASSSDSLSSYGSTASLSTMSDGSPRDRANSSVSSASSPSLRSADLESLVGRFRDSNKEIAGGAPSPISTPSTPKARGASSQSRS